MLPSIPFRITEDSHRELIEFPIPTKQNTPQPSQSIGDTSEGAAAEVALGAVAWGGLVPASRTTPAKAAPSPMIAGASRPFPWESSSPKTVVPNTTLARSVTALLDAMVGAKTPVFSADCWNTKPTTADAIST